MNLLNFLLFSYNIISNLKWYRNETDQNLPLSLDLVPRLIAFSGFCALVLRPMYLILQKSLGSWRLPLSRLSVCCASTPARGGMATHGREDQRTQPLADSGTQPDTGDTKTHVILIYDCTILHLPVSVHLSALSACPQPTRALRGFYDAGCSRRCHGLPQW